MVTFNRTAATPPALAGMPYGIDRIRVVLIKPSSYDDDGFVQRYWRAVMPCHGLGVMKVLCERSLGLILPAGVRSQVRIFEDGVLWHSIKLWWLYWWCYFFGRRTRLIVGLVSVQTSQWPRAMDLAARWQKLGAQCVIGGPHVTGSITVMYDGIFETDRTLPCPRQMPLEIEAALANDIVVFHGEAEPTPERDVLSLMLKDLVEGRARPMYRGGRPDLDWAPLPQYSRRYLKQYVARHRPIDAERGCPFKCKFCAEINTYGRKVRSRDPQAIVDHIAAVAAREPGAGFFLCGDNFARNPHWRKILDGLIALRQHGLKFKFMVQSDLKCGKLPGFIEKLGQAGCSQIFFGVESLNPKNLEQAGKSQNNIEAYAELWQLCHDQGIAVHAAYIIGFDADTPESVDRDVRQLLALGADQASFYIKMPNPGSQDFLEATLAQRPMDPDFNHHDTFHPTIWHRSMSGPEWFGAYQRAWREFYRPRHMISALKRLPDRERRMRMFCNDMWYWWATRAERTHPMIAGWYRWRSFWDRRPGSPRWPFSRYVMSEVWRHLHYAGLLLAGFYVFQHVFFEVECAPWLSRNWLNRFWIKYGGRKWRLLNPLRFDWHLCAIPYALAEVAYTIYFVCQIPRVVKSMTK